jgi:Zn-dependent M28 family amino/carboxypeptidase
LEREQSVRLRLDVAADFYENEGLAYNTLAEFPGRGRSDELVLAGAHLDSYHAGTGATDNACGVAVVMEAMRILKAVGAEPRRTIRVCLWSGEEQGLLGSKAYVSEHFAGRPPWTDAEQLTLPMSLREETGPLSFYPQHTKVSAYYNFDNGGGKIRGIYLEENAALRPIFTAWLAPLADLGVTAISLNTTGGTDHRSFNQVGIPGFQFMQDPLDYMPQTHHTHLDTYDHLVAADLKQAAVVMASVIIHTANRDRMLPRKPRPREDEETP